jgi:hypothetical protein
VAGGDPENEGEMLSEELQEIVPDYLSVYAQDKEAATAFEQLRPAEQDALLEQAFPRGRHYGL